MKVEIRDGTVHLSGYINAVERFSKPITENLHGKMRTFLERIQAGAFAASLKRRKKVDVLINHDEKSKITDTLQADCILHEDKIGLHFDISSSNPKLLRALKRGFSGCSFGMVVINDVLGTLDGMCTRTITSLDLIEVSILDTRKMPAYDGSMIEARNHKGGKTMEIRTDDIATMTLREFIEKFGEETFTDVLSGLKSAILNENSETRTENNIDADKSHDDDINEDIDNEDIDNEDIDNEDDDGEDDGGEDDDGEDDDGEDDDGEEKKENRANYSYFEERLKAL